MAHPDDDGSDLHAAVDLRLRAAGMRNSRSRQVVVDVLVRAGRPLSLPEILDADADLAQSSTYRNLGELVDAGVTRRVESADDHTRFELHESLTGHHHHLVCTSCGRVEDFDVPDDFEAGIDVMVDAAESQGFRIDAHRFDLLGRCARCS
ncbi:MAG: Fur family transcriptional regulator [Acidimicrobiales bacterium]|jgi:Fe2+ or Zn2+ uptake regulation protein|nr:transcriptional repressor [Actinomycetes bacterium]MDP6106304.1 Fur family transcriptional regulator [Acidimicrobiales bacterium]MDP6493291.1 Fur family transcriptional regulator [Acidimicrobiales bacterium]MDP6760834.1 Fur family transcriptional regulator [Acidimicrobiales bacterium]|tara:strand:- start:2159 stop:2608 length:450 start_codon:yes stop_codon:yes gene_type:complete